MVQEEDAVEFDVGSIESSGVGRLGGFARRAWSPPTRVQNAVLAQQLAQTGLRQARLNLYPVVGLTAIGATSGDVRHQFDRFRPTRFSTHRRMGTFKAMSPIMAQP